MNSSGETPKKNQLKLECVLGLTCSSPFGFVTLEDDSIIYPAGASAVKYNFQSDKQVSYLIAQNAPKSISCLSKSQDASLVVVGESGHQPRILIYDIKEEKLIASLAGHKYGVLTAQFSPDMQFLVSIGFHHDGFIYLWEWKARKRLCGAKITTPLFSFAFDPLSNYFVTTGVQHIKFWDLKNIREKMNSSNTKKEAPSSLLSSESPSLFSLEGKAGLLGEHKGVTLVDVCCLESQVEGVSQSLTYAITLNGYLLMFNASGVLEKWLHAKMEKGSCIRATSAYIICGGSEGKVRLFEPVTLKHLGNIPPPEPLLTTVTNETPNIYPQIVCIQATRLSSNIVIVYSNMTLIILDLKDPKKPTQIHKMQNHSDCIWGVQPFTMNPSPNSSHEKDGFITYSSDGSVRFWDSTLLNESEQNQHQTPSYITTLMADPNGAKKFQYFDRFGSTNDIKSVTERTGIRSFAIDPDKTMIACGDRNGSIGIFTFDDFKKIATIEAHDAEIMVLDFAVIGSEETLVLSSASRDRLIHIFDATSKDDGVYPFDLLQTLDDHSSTLTSIMFADSGSKLISCGADKAIIFRSLQDEIHLNFATYRNTPLRSTVYDMALAQVSRIIITASQDKRITFLDIDSGKPTKSLAPTLQSADSSSKATPFLNTLTTDPTGSIICAGASDKTVHLIDSQSGNSLFQGQGHGDLVTNVSFINQGSHIVSTSADGCIFIWKVPEAIIKKMGYLPKLSNLSLPKLPGNNTNYSPSETSPAVFQFEESHLPSWARKSSEKNDSSEAGNLQIQQQAKGRWAERVNRKEGVKLYTDISLKDDEEKKDNSDAVNSLEAFHSEGKFSSAADISIHIVDSSDISFSATNETAPNSERLIQDPFADTIETDSEDAMSEVLDFSDGPSFSTDRNSLSLQYFLKTNPSKTSISTTQPEKQQIEAQYQQPENSIVSAAKEKSPTIKVTPIKEDELSMFLELAQKTSTNVSLLANPKATQALEKVQKLANETLKMGNPADLNENERIQHLLERYSDRLVKLVQEKLEKLNKEGG